MSKASIALTALWFGMMAALGFLAGQGIVHLEAVQHMADISGCHGCLQ